MKINKEKRIKGELILKAIGELPDEMVVWENMEELMAGAEKLNKQKRKAVILHRCIYAAVAAVCAAVLVFSSGLLKKPVKPDVNPSFYVPDEQQDTKTSINLFAAAFKTEALNETEDKDINKEEKSSGNAKKSSEDISGSDDSTDISIGNIKANGQLKEFTEGATHKLPVIQDENDSPGNSGNGKMYIVFMPGTDIYFVPSYNNGGTYILGEEEDVKIYIKEDDKAYCNAGNQVYFDISGAEDKLDNVKDIDIPEWNSDGIGILAYVKVYLPEEHGSSVNEAGIFYIGKKDTSKGVVYYGMFKCSMEAGADSGTVIKPEHTVYSKSGRSAGINKSIAGKRKNDVVFYNNVPVYSKNEKKKIRKYLASLPDNLTEKKAKEMGIVIETYSYKKKNKFKNEWLDFYKYVKKGEDIFRTGKPAYVEYQYMAAIVVLKYTIEGDACYDYISFINGEYYVYSDSSRDKYKAGSWDGYSEIGIYKFLKKRNVEYKESDKDKYLSIEYTLFKKMDITNKEADKIILQNNSYVKKYYNIFGYYK